MLRFKKKTIVFVLCLITVCVAVVPLIVMAESEFGDWEKFYTYNKSIMQRHAHPRKLMRLPIIRQAANYTSGVACVQSVMRYADYCFDIREDNLKEALKATEADGTKWYNMVNYLNAVRLDDKEAQCFRARKEEHMTVDGLLDEIDQGHPVICAIQAWGYDENEEYTMDLDYSDEWECGHWVVAVGYNKDNIFFMDPSTAGNYTYIPKDKLVARWHDYNVDENNQRYDSIQLGLIVEICGNKPEGERYHDAFYGLM